MPDTYRSLEELVRSEAAADYRVLVRDRQSHVTVVAPHGGRIEPGTSQLAESVAGESWNLFAFEGLKPRGNSVLHVTSTRFSHPELELLLARSTVGVSVHGMAEPGLLVEVGGLNARLVKLISLELSQERFDVCSAPPSRSAQSPQNFINRVAGGGIQLEVSQDLRKLFQEDRARLSRFGTAVRAAISRHLDEGKPPSEKDDAD